MLLKRGLPSSRAAPLDRVIRSVYDLTMRPTPAFNTLTVSQRSFLSVLQDEQIHYLITGSYAGRYYGIQRPPRDLDIVVMREVENIAQLVTALSKLPCVNLESLRAQFVEPDKAFHWKDVEVSNGVPHVSIPDLFAERMLVQHEEFLLPLISRHLFVQGKLFALADPKRPQHKRKQDLADLQTLLNTGC